jgi:putative ABC transport system permease protein
MRIARKVRDAFRAVIRFRRRSILMMLGIAVGVGGLTTLNSIGENTRRVTMQRVRNMLGTFDTLLIRPGGGRTRGMVSLATVEPVLKFNDAAAIAAVAEVKQVALVQNAFDIDVSYRDRQANPAVFGVSANWLDLRGDQVEHGSFFTAADDVALARVAVIGADARNALFPGEDPLGQTIRVGGVPFEVRGLLASRGAGPAGGSLDNIVLIPVSTASKRLFHRDFLTMLVTQLRDPQQAAAVDRKLNALLRDRHHLAPTALDDFTITNPAAVLAQLTGVASTLSRVLTGVAALAMLIGGLVVMSLMTIGVTERRGEIGLRRAVGADRGDILLQFLLEALWIALLGGALGIAVGLGGANAVAFYQKLPPLFERDALLTSLALSCGSGLLFGIYPAWRASRIDPVAALRS